MAVSDLDRVRHRPETLRETQLRMELAVRHAEALEFVARLTPIHSRLYTVTSHISPEAVRLVGHAMAVTTSYARKQEAS